MDINLVLLKLASASDSLFPLADRQALQYEPAPVGGGSPGMIFSSPPPRASMGALRELEGQDPTLNPRLNHIPLGDQAHAAMDSATDHVKHFFSTPGGQIAAAAGLLGLGALSHHIATKGRHKPQVED